MCDFAADAQAAEQGRSDTAIKKKQAKCAKPYRSTNVVHTTLVRRFSRSCG